MKCGELLPPLIEITQLSREIAFKVGQLAQKQGHALACSDDELLQKIESNYWKPQYREYRRTSS